MPRSFDITRKPRYKPAPSTPAPTASPSPRRNKKRGGFIFLVFAIGVIALGFSFNSLSKKPIVKNAHTTKPAAKPSTKSDAITSSTKSPDKNPSPPATDKPIENKLKIQILNGTGIETVTDQVKKLLETNSLPVESTSKAQFEYSQTYIYYRPAAVETAKKISEILSAYKPTLSESQISGLFDILVIIGKQNLPPAS